MIFKFPKTEFFNQSLPALIKLIDDIVFYVNNISHNFCLQTGFFFKPFSDPLHVTDKAVGMLALAKFTRLLVAAKSIELAILIAAKPLNYVARFTLDFDGLYSSFSQKGFNFLILRREHYESN
jgi:hypothetical protein